MKKDYEKAFQMMQEITDCYSEEIKILINRLKYLEYFIDKFGCERPNGKQEIACFKLIDTLKDIINGKISAEINYE